jgi:hypothetical protein
MTQVPVNDARSEASTPPAPPRRQARPRVLAAIGVAGIGLALSWFIVLPWLLRNRVEAVLRGAGVGDVTFHVAEATPWGSTLTSVEAGEQDALGIERLKIEYSPWDLWNGRLHALRIRGARLELRVREGRVDLSPLTAFVLGKDRPTTKAISPGPAAGEMSLPLERITLVDSTIVFQTDRGAVQIPVDLEVRNRDRDQLLITAHAGPQRDLIFHATVDLTRSTATFTAAANPGWILLTVRSIFPGTMAAVDGRMTLRGDMAWGDESPAGKLRLVIARPPASAKLADAQLKLSGGVFEVAGQLGPEAAVRITVSDAALAGEGFAMSGVSGAVALSSVSPPKTAPGQRVTVSELDIGGVKLADGVMEFQVNDARSIFVDRVSWKAFGGRIMADDFPVEAGEPLALTLHASEIELKELLATFAKDKASGEGKLSGELPIIVDGSDVTFGDGQAIALERGRLQIREAAALAPAAESAAAAAQSPSQSEQIKRNIIEALSDFEYDRLTARLDDENGKGLSAFVRLSGRGRTGARQALDYDLRIRGLDGLIRSYLGIRRSMNEAESPRKAESP